MYLTISPQKLSQNFAQSARDFVNYLEKENEGLDSNASSFFFNQYEEQIGPAEVIATIDGNTAKLKQSEPKFYSITINPSQRELEHIGEDKKKLISFTREAMKQYATSFHREINGRAITSADIKYFAKIETRRTFKGYDRQVIENRPYLKEIVRIENNIQKLQRGEISGNIRRLQKELTVLREATPHKLNGKIIEEGMQKQGLQTHIHIIVSRKDASNSYSLSPGSKYRSSEVVMHGKVVKRGFDRDLFFANSEKAFDRMFDYNRNFVESYGARKVFAKNAHDYYAHLKGLSPAEKRIAFSILNQSGIRLPVLNFAPNQVSFALKHIKKALQVGIRSSSIGY